MPAVKVVILTGGGKAFCSGADLNAMQRRSTAGASGAKELSRILMEVFAPLIEGIVQLEKPVIAAVNGPAVGIGMALALCCDLITMSSQAFLLAPFSTVGLVPDGGLCWFLARRIGYSRTFELIAEARRLDADRCLQLGIVNRVVASTELYPSTIQWARELAERAPLSLRFAKRITRSALGNSLPDSLLLEAQLQGDCIASADAQEGIAALRDKRLPRFQGC